GEDYAAEIGTPILAHENGKVSMTGYDDGAGHIVCFVPEGYPELEMRSFHCTGKFPHAAGTPVKRGEAIGYTGDSGIGTGPHWHVEIRIDGMPIDPRWYLGMATWFQEAE
ncbi:MAG: M23 family metallopeptidase, partial [Phormidesmis sp.]